MSNRESPQLVLKYTYRTVENPHTPYLDWTWEAGPGVTHVWPALWYVTWGGFRFVRQKGEDEGRVFLFYGDGTDPRWRLAAEYAGWADAWYMNSWNCKFGCNL